MQLINYVIMLLIIINMLNSYTLNLAIVGNANELFYKRNI